ncbi:MAG TPA: hypothetical protein V6D10_07640 [Trichocoleus sp.]|jgi:hypothetical protein
MIQLSGLCRDNSFLSNESDHLCQDLKNYAQITTFLKMVNLYSKATLPVLPEHFPNQIAQPKLKIGDRVRWCPLPSEDFGIITGIEYTPAEHRDSWGWRYTVWLDAHSPSRNWTMTDIASEEDLELLPLALAHANQEVSRE